MKLKLGIQIALLLLIVFLSYELYQSIKEPIVFKNEKDKRYDAVINRLKEIRALQIAYKQRHGLYSDNWDTLIHFAKSESFRVVKAIGTRPDSIATDAQALAMGLIKRDTLYVNVRDSLFKTKMHIDSLKFVPFGKGEIFFLAKDTIRTSSGVTVPVFEANVHNKVILNGLSKKEIINMNAEAKKLKRFPGLKVGDVKEPNNNAGNWE
jgi:hypothetical protein